MRGRGVSSTEGRLRLCGTCGGVVAFVELYGDGRMTNAESKRLVAATAAHFETSRACADGSTFDGHDVTACRCGAPLRMERPQGLFCAKCNGLIAPHLRHVPLAPSEEKPCRRFSTRS
jgi:hypothetical protein